MRIPLVFPQGSGCRKSLLTQCTIEGTQLLVDTLYVFLEVAGPHEPLFTVQTLKRSDLVVQSLNLAHHFEQRFSWRQEVLLDAYLGLDIRGGIVEFSIYPTVLD